MLKLFKSVRQSTGSATESLFYYLSTLMSSGLNEDSSLSCFCDINDIKEISFIVPPWINVVQSMSPPIGCIVVFHYAIQLTCDWF